MTHPTNSGEATAVRLSDPEFRTDPYGAYARLREHSPVVPRRLSDGSYLWLVTRHEDVHTMLRDRRIANSSGSVPGSGSNVRAQMLAQFGLPEEYIPYLVETILDADPPDHTRLRRLVSRAFTVRRVTELRPRVEQLARDLLDELPAHRENGVVDLVEHFAYPLPITVICELVGVPEADRPAWREWSSALMQVEDVDAINRARREMVDNIRGLLERERVSPSDSLLGALIRVHDEEVGRLTETELVTMVLTLISAGHETTAHLISNGLLALLSHPEQRRLLRDDPGLAPGAVHELLRWCGPVILTRPRYATADLTIADTQIRTGEMLQGVLLAANRDPRRFPDADRLDLTRESPRPGDEHLQFGTGVHYCLGAALASQEAEVAFTSLLRHYPGMELAVPEEELQWRELPSMRRLARLPVRL